MRVASRFTDAKLSCIVESRRCSMDLACNDAAI